MEAKYLTSTPQVAAVVDPRGLRGQLVGQVSEVA